jgi:hypothetical protein
VVCQEVDAKTIRMKDDGEETRLTATDGPLASEPLSDVVQI